MATSSSRITPRHQSASWPLRRLLSQPRTVVGRILDYGCGNGNDVSFLRSQGYDATGYDPVTFPTLDITQRYDTILCTYVFNVIDEADEPVVLNNIRTLLAPHGVAYITVPRHQKEWGFYYRGGHRCGARFVSLPLPTIFDFRKFTTYVLSADNTNAIHDHNSDNTPIIARGTVVGNKKLSAKKLSSAACAAADNSRHGYGNRPITDEEKIEVRKKEQQALKFLKSIAKAHPDEPIFLAYSGGKDSEIIYHLAHKTGIEFTPVYNATTIDPPGTLKWIQDKGDVMIMRPRRDFFTLLKHRGIPNKFHRVCCEKLKERYLGRHLITGIRQEESINRRKKNPEPEKCMVYKHGQKARHYMPILYWTIRDIEVYVQLENIKLNPYYYGEDGSLHCERRLGCMGCPLPYNHSIDDFKRWPRLVKLWCRAQAEYRNTRPEVTSTISWFEDEYETFYHHMFHKSIDELHYARQSPNWNPKARLEEIFHIELPPPQSRLDDIKAKLSTLNYSNYDRERAHRVD